MKVNNLNLKYKSLREDNDKTQQEIADFLNEKRSTYSKWESGYNDIPLEKANELANYYHTSLDYLLGLSNKHLKIDKNLNIDWQKISSRLKTLRKEHKLTQTELGNKVGFLQKTYSQYENVTFKITTNKLLYIAKFYNVSMDYLTGRLDKKHII